MSTLAHNTCLSAQGTNAHTHTHTLSLSLSLSLSLFLSLPCKSHRRRPIQTGPLTPSLSFFISAATSCSLNQSVELSFTHFIERGFLFRSGLHSIKGGGPFVRRFVRPSEAKRQKARLTGWRGCTHYGSGGEINAAVAAVEEQRRRRPAAQRLLRWTDRRVVARRSVQHYDRLRVGRTGFCFSSR